MLKTRKGFLFISLILFFVGSCAFAQADYRENFSQTLPLKAGDTFSLSNVNGDVTVSTWRENMVKIEAVKIAKRAEKDLKEVEILVEESSDGVSVKAVWPKLRRNLRVSVRFEVKVPENVILNPVKTVNGSVNLSGRYEKAYGGTTNGTVIAEDIVGDLNASTTNGNVRVRDLDGRLEASTTNGGVRIEGLVFNDGVRARATNGSISLRMESPERINADLSARTSNGSISVDFPVTLKNLRQSKRVVEARIGEGGPEISLRTTNGSIKILK